MPAWQDKSSAFSSHSPEFFSSLYKILKKPKTHKSDVPREGMCEGAALEKVPSGARRPKIFEFVAHQL
jgi:hypothetical protein